MNKQFVTLTEEFETDLMVTVVNGEITDVCFGNESEVPPGAKTMTLPAGARLQVARFRRDARTEVMVPMSYVGTLFNAYATANFHITIRIPTALHGAAETDHGPEEITYTTAPADYDYVGFGTRELAVLGQNSQGKTIRKVATPRGFYTENQRARYASGLHMAVDETNWQVLTDAGLGVLK